MTKIVIFIAVLLTAFCARAQESVPFSVETLSDEVYASMLGRSLPKEAVGIGREDLRVVNVVFRDVQGLDRTGCLIVNKDIAQEMAEIFQELYELCYPFDTVTPIDAFYADDEKSMAANNTSAFCYRRISGSKKLSKHSLGLAIDLNPLYNPCFTVARDNEGRVIGCRNVQPESGERYTDRSIITPFTLTADHPVVKLFKSKGYRWGGDWKNKKDYQHFEK